MKQLFSMARISGVISLFLTTGLFMASCSGSRVDSIPRAQATPSATLKQGLTPMAVLPVDADGNCTVGTFDPTTGGCLTQITDDHSKCSTVCRNWFNDNGTDMAAMYALGPSNGGAWVACTDPTVPGCYSVVFNPCYIPPGADDGQGHTLVSDVISGSPQLQSLLAYLANKGIETRVIYNTTEKTVTGTSADGNTKTYKEAAFHDNTGHIKDADITVYLQVTGLHPGSGFEEVLYHEFLHDFFRWMNAGVVTDTYNIPRTGIATAMVDGFTYSYDLSNPVDHDAFEHIAIHDILQHTFGNDTTGALLEGIVNRPRTDAQGHAASPLDTGAANATRQLHSSDQIATSGATITPPPANQTCASGASAAAIYSMAVFNDGEDGIPAPDFIETYSEVSN